MRFITVITGLPRSGTTLMMRMVEAGGIEPYYDTTRPLKWTENGTEFVNYNRILRESDKVHSLKTGDGKWVAECYGMALKICTPTEVTPPEGLRYRFIYMDRKPKQMATSQKKFADKTGLTPPREVLPLVIGIKKYRKASIRLLKGYRDSEFMLVRFEDLITRPLRVAERVAKYLGIDAGKAESMAGIVVSRPVSCLPVMMEEAFYLNN